MSLTRILCEKCGFPLAFCACGRETMPDGPANPTPSQNNPVDGEKAHKQRFSHIVMQTIECLATELRKHNDLVDSPATCAKCGFKMHAPTTGKILSACPECYGDMKTDVVYATLSAFKQTEQGTPRTAAVLVRELMAWSVVPLGIGTNQYEFHAVAREAAAQLAALQQKVEEMTKEEVRRISHLNRLATWAQQDPTGPWEKLEIQKWVLSELKSALGQRADETAWQPEVLTLRTALAAVTRQNEEMGKEVADHERWFKEMVADYRLQADDHKASWRYAINCLIHKHRDGESTALSQVEMMKGDAKRLDWLDAHCSFVADHPYAIGPFKVGELRKMADAGLAIDAALPQVPPPSPGTTEAEGGR